MKPTMLVRSFWMLCCVLSLTSLPFVAIAQQSGPRDGKYLIMSYGAAGSPPLYLGSVVLSGHKYKAYLPGDKSSGEGEWTFDGANKRVIWKSGPYKDTWEGKFEIDRGGKTHKIRLKSNTIATNSVD